jgi:PST family polysaccharide transporter
VLGATLCIVCAEEVVHLILGSKWSTAVPVFRIVAAWALMFYSVQMLSWFLIASGRARRVLDLSLLLSPAIVLGVVIGLPYGIDGVATGMLVATAVVAGPMVLWARAGSALKARDVFRSMARPGLAAIVAGSTGFALKGSGLIDAHVAVKLFAYGLTVAAVFGVVLFFPFTRNSTYVALSKHVHYSLTARR